MLCVQQIYFLASCFVKVLNLCCYRRSSDQRSLMIDMRVSMWQFSGLTIGGVVALQITAHFHKMFVVVYLYLLTSVILQPYCSAQLNQKSV